MQIIADLQLHSKYSRAVSPEMIIPKMYEWNLKKGIGLLATGDWTHPLWVRELKAHLEERGDGLLKIRESAKKNLAFNPAISHGDPLFLLSGEVSCIYSHNGKTRRNRILMFAPSFDVVEKVNAALVKRGCNISSDGRPILGLSSQDVCELVWSISEEVLLIPAHAWTPWFSLYGSMSGYDSIDECFGKYSDRIYAIETGLSSDPAMNWRIAELDTRTIISCSDSHSGPKLMREATIFTIPDGKPSFDAIATAIKNYKRDTTKPHIEATIEFYPEEGKYHFDGHRNCNVRMIPSDTKKKGTTCPVCGKPMTIGVLHRIEDLATRSEADLKIVRRTLGEYPVEAIYSETFPNRAPYIMMVPLLEIIAESLHSKSYSKKVYEIYDSLVAAVGGEFTALLKTPISDISRIAGPRVAEGIDRVRRGDIVIEPGYDGVFGVVKIWKEDAKVKKGAVNPTTLNENDQMSLL